MASIRANSGSGGVSGNAVFGDTTIATSGTPISVNLGFQPKKVSVFTSTGSGINLFAVNDNGTTLLAGYMWSDNAWHPGYIALAITSTGFTFTQSITTGLAGVTLYYFAEP